MRAHANCVENLPLFGAIVFVLYVGKVTSSVVNILAIAIPGGPHAAVARPCMFHSDKHRGVDPIRFLCRTDHRLSLVDWHHSGQYEWERITHPRAKNLPTRCALAYQSIPAHRADIGNHRRLDQND